MNAKFLKPFETMFLVTQAKWSKMTYKATANYMRKSETIIKKWLKRDLQVGNVDDLLDPREVGGGTILGDNYKGGYSKR